MKDREMQRKKDRGAALNVRVPVDLRKTIEIKAAERDLDLSDIVRRMLDYAVKNCPQSLM